SPLPPAPTSTLFPYTTLFRSVLAQDGTGRHRGFVRGESAQDFLLFALRHLEVIKRAGELRGDFVELSRRELEIEMGIAQSFARRSEEHTSELQSRSDLVCRLL